MKKTAQFNLAVAINTFTMICLLSIMFVLIWIMYHYTQPEAVDQARIAERRKDLAELNAQAKDVLENYAWIDQTKGLVRLPLARAMELTVAGWQNPAVARSNLISRLAKVTTPPAPTAPTNSASVGADKK